MSISFSCPECGKTLKVKVEHSGRRAHCPGCQAEVRVPPSPVAPTIEAKAEEDAAERSGMATAKRAAAVTMLLVAVPIAFVCAAALLMCLANIGVALFATQATGAKRDILRVMGLNGILSLVGFLFSGTAYNLAKDHSPFMTFLSRRCSRILLAGVIVGFLSAVANFLLPIG